MFKVNLSFRIFHLTEGFGVEMRFLLFLMMKVDVWIISGIFRVNRRLISYLKLLCNFCWKVTESKFTWHFLFLHLNPSCFKTVLTMVLRPTYLLLLLEIQNFNDQFYVKRGEWWDFYTFYPILVLRKFLIAYNWNNQH